jgi:hypothetical protein
VIITAIETIETTILLCIEIKICTLQEIFYTAWRGIRTLA